MSNHEETTEYVTGRSLINVNEPLSPKKPILDFLQLMNQQNQDTHVDSSSFDTIDSDHSYPVESQYTPKQRHRTFRGMLSNMIDPLVKRS